MKKYFVLILIFTSVSTSYSQQNSAKYFPLQIGNRWDYNVDVHINGGIYYTDTLSVSIVDTLTIKGNKYFQFSSSLPFVYQNPEYYRTENDKVYIFDESDSSDCYIFRFDWTPNTPYINCQGSDIFYVFSDTVSLWGKMDIQQNQDNFIFSENYGIYHAFAGGIEERTYTLSGCIISGVKYGKLLTSIHEIRKNSLSFKLSQNYPNPFNPITTINYSIPQRSRVELKVFNILGKPVATLVNEEKQKGNYQVKFDASSLSSGIYLYRLKADNLVETKKLIILK